MSIIKCMAIASASIVVIMVIVSVIKSFLDSEEFLFFILKLVLAIGLGGTFLFVILNIINS